MSNSVTISDKNGTRTINLNSEEYKLFKEEQDIQIKQYKDKLIERFEMGLTSDIDISNEIWCSGGFITDHTLHALEREKYELKYNGFKNGSYTFFFKGSEFNNYNTLDFNNKHEKYIEITYRYKLHPDDQNNLSDEIIYQFVKETNLINISMSKHFSQLFYNVNHNSYQLCDLLQSYFKRVFPNSLFRYEFTPLHSKYYYSNKYNDKESGEICNYIIYSDTNENILDIIFKCEDLLSDCKTFIRNLKSHLSERFGDREYIFYSHISKPEDEFVYTSPHYYHWENTPGQYYFDSRTVQFSKKFNPNKCLLTERIINDSKKSLQKIIDSLKYKKTHELLTLRTEIDKIIKHEDCMV